MTLVEKALRLAVAAHKEQVRKSDGSPYVVHPIMVARILEKHGFGEAVVAAGVTHDVLEDTAMTAAELEAALGSEVLRMVTAVSEDTDIPWRERKLEYIESVAAASEGAKAVSVADKIHNAHSLLDAHAEMGEAVWEVFTKEKDEKIWFERTLCDRLQTVWTHSLLDEYAELVDRLETLIR